MNCVEIRINMKRLIECSGLIPAVNGKLVTLYAKTSLKNFVLPLVCYFEAGFNFIKMLFYCYWMMKPTTIYKISAAYHKKEQNYPKHMSHMRLIDYLRIFFSKRIENALKGNYLFRNRNWEYKRKGNISK